MARVSLLLGTFALTMWSVPAFRALVNISSHTGEQLALTAGSNVSTRGVLWTKEQVIKYLYHEQTPHPVFGNGHRILDRRGIHPDSPKAREVQERFRAQRIIMLKLHLLDGIGSLGAISEVLKAAVAFGIIATKYENKQHQTLARQVVDKCVELYNGDDWKAKVPVLTEEYQHKIGVKQDAYEKDDAMNHYFTIYLMTWKPQKEGVIHTHGESACSFKFLKETDGAANLNFELDRRTYHTNAFTDGKEHKGFAVAQDDPRARDYKANLKSLTAYEVIQSRDLIGKKVAYIQDDIGAHRIDNMGLEHVYSIHIYYPAYEYFWLFSNPWAKEPQDYHFKEGASDPHDKPFRNWGYSNFKANHGKRPDPRSFLPTGGLRPGLSNESP